MRQTRIVCPVPPFIGSVLSAKNIPAVAFGSLPLIPMTFIVSRSKYFILAFRFGMFLHLDSKSLYSGEASNVFSIKVSISSPSFGIISSATQTAFEMSFFLRCPEYGMIYSRRDASIFVTPFAKASSEPGALPVRKHAPG